MTDEPENLTLRILQEMREEIRSRLGVIESKITGLDEKFTDLTQRIDGNTLVFNLVAGVVYDHEGRIVTLEVRESVSK